MDHKRNVLDTWSWTRTVALASLIFLLALAPHSLAQGGRTVADGVYSAEQAQNGRQIFDKKCASCHDGGTMGPELSGAAFLNQWRKKDAEALYKSIADTMPQDAPGSLSEEETLDTIAYILQQNEFAPGSTRLISRKQLVGMKFPLPN